MRHNSTSDRRREPFLRVPDRYLKDRTLTAVQKLALARFERWQAINDTFFCSWQSLADEIGISPYTARNVIDGLLERGWIVKVETKPGRKPVFRLLETPTKLVGVQPPTDPDQIGRGPRANQSGTPTKSVALFQRTVLEEEIEERPRRAARAQTHPPKRKKPDARDGWFETWYGTYPKKLGKDSARHAFGKHIRSPQDFDHLMRITAAYEEKAWRHRPRRFTPYPGSFLNGKKEGGAHWKDDPAGIPDYTEGEKRSIEEMVRRG